MHGHVARKRFGQNFLADPHYTARIVDAVDPQPGENVVEIGPGLAAITGGLIERAGHVTAIEIDRDLAARLREQFAPEQLTLHVADALEFDFASLPADLRIVGNLPYNISSPILFHCLDHIDAIRDMHFMLQKEVVERMAAAPGSKVYGRLSVMLQLVCRVEPLLRVPAGAFRPPPKVESAVVRLTPRPESERASADARLVADIVRAAFGQRRKTLSNALSGVADAEEIARAGVDPRTRAEQLPPSAFVALANVVQARRQTVG